MTEVPAITLKERVHNVVFPADQLELLPLYVAGGSSLITEVRRHEALLATNCTVSFETYFNAFPASHWQTYTTVREVTLNLELDGFASVELHRSNADGIDSTIARCETGGGEVSLTAPLDSFDEGGWLWFGVTTADAPVRLSNAYWSITPLAPNTNGSRAVVAITTFNRPDDCVTQLNRFITEPEVLARLTQVVIVDQGTQHVRDAKGYTDAAAALGEQFQLIEQPNLGGSGGFTRGMVEAVDAGAEYVIVLDDDAVAEPEAILRAIAFADHAKVPTIVGSQMFNLSEPTVMHSFGETINMHDFWWHAIDGKLSTLDLAKHPLAQTPRLHRRLDVAYNGWWMCLIPTSVLKDIGFPLPLFIKWDDAEYGLRASDAGFPTVSLPGVAAWHVPWTEKDDGLDWQAYFHVRNRLVTALLHSPEAHGGALPRALFVGDVHHLVCMQYVVQTLRLWALEDVLRGPDHLHDSITHRAADARALFAAAGKLPTRDPAEFPSSREPASKSVDGAPNKRPNNPFALVWRAARALTHQLSSTKPQSPDQVDAIVPAKAGRWWRIGTLDSAAVATADGRGVFVYRRDREQFKQLFKQSRKLNRRIRKEWAELARTYRDALPEVTSEDTWHETFTR